MLKLLTALAVFVALMAFAAVAAILIGWAFSALTQSHWWQRTSESGNADGSGSPYGDQGDQRVASFDHCSFGGSGEGCDTGSTGS
jgi:hypothetical protein